MKSMGKRRKVFLRKTLSSQSHFKQQQQPQYHHHADEEQPVSSSSSLDATTPQKQTLKETGAGAGAAAAAALAVTKTPPVTPESDSGDSQLEWNRQHYHTASNSSPVGEVVTIKSRPPSTANANTATSSSPSSSSSVPATATATALGGVGSFRNKARIGLSRLSLKGKTKKDNLGHYENAAAAAADSADDGTLMSELTDNRTYTRLEPSAPKAPRLQPHHSMRDSTLGPIQEGATNGNGDEKKKDDDAAARRRSSVSSSQKSAASASGGGGGGGVAVASYHRGKLSKSEQQKQQQQKLKHLADDAKKTSSNNNVVAADNDNDDEEDISPAAFITNIFGIVDLACSSSTRNSTLPPFDDDHHDKKLYSRQLLKAAAPAAAAAAVRDFAPEWGVAPSFDQETDIGGTLQEKEKALAEAAAKKKRLHKAAAAAAASAPAPAPSTNKDAADDDNHHHDVDEPPLDHLEHTDDDDDDDSIFSGDNDQPREQQGATSTTQVRTTRQDPQGQGPSVFDSSTNNSDDGKQMDAPAAASVDKSGANAAVVASPPPPTTHGGWMSSSDSQRATMMTMDAASSSAAAAASAADNRSIVDHENFEMVLEDLALQEQLEHGGGGDDKQMNHHGSSKLSGNAGARWIGRALGLGKSKTTPSTNVANNNTFSAAQITTITSGSNNAININNNKSRSFGSQEEEEDDYDDEGKQDLVVLGINSLSMLNSMEKSRPVGPGELLATAPAPMPSSLAAVTNNTNNAATRATPTPPPHPATAEAGIPRTRSVHSGSSSSITSAGGRFYQGGWQNVVFPETRKQQQQQQEQLVVCTTSPRKQLEDELFAAIALSSPTITSQDASSSKRSSPVTTGKSTPVLSPTPTVDATAAAAAAAYPGVPQFEPSALATSSAARYTMESPTPAASTTTSPLSIMKSAQSIAPPIATNNAAAMMTTTTTPRPSNSTLYYRPQKKAPIVEVTEEKKDEGDDDDDDAVASFASQKSPSNQLNAFKHLAFARRAPRAQSDTETATKHLAFSRRVRKSQDPIAAASAASDTETATKYFAYTTRRGLSGAASSVGGQSDTEMSTSRKNSRFRSLTGGGAATAAAVTTTTAGANHDSRAPSDSETRKPIFRLSHLKKKVIRSRMRRRKGTDNGKNSASSCNNNPHHQQSMAGSTEELKARGPGVYLRDLDLIGDEVVEDLYANLDRQIEQEEDQVPHQPDHYDDGGGGGRYLGSTSMEDQETTASEQEQSMDNSYLGSIPGLSHMTDLSQLTMDTATRDGEEAYGRRGQGRYEVQKSLVLPIKQSSSSSTHSTQSQKGRATGGKANVLNGFMSYISGKAKRNASNTNGDKLGAADHQVLASADQVEVAARVAGVTQRDPDGEKKTIEEGLEPVDHQQQKQQQLYEASVPGSEGMMDPVTSGASVLEKKHPILEKVSDTPNIPISKSWNPNDGEKRPDPAPSVPSASASATASAEETTMELKRNITAPMKLSPRKFSQKGKKTIWKPALDPVSGRTYYYHRLTRKTTWTKPADLDTVFEEEEEPTERTLEPTETSERDGEGNGTVTESRTSVHRTDALNVEDVIRKTKARDFDQGIWQQKQEIAKLLKTMAPPDGKSIENLMMEYEGRESELLMQLRDLKESRPFDEPLATDSVTSEEHATRSFPKASSLNPQTSSSAFSDASELKSRVRTATSGRSGRSERTTRSGGTKISEKTELIRNTAGGRKMVAAARIDELGSASECTSLSSEGMELRAMSNGAVKKTMNRSRSSEGMELRAMSPNGEVKETMSTRRTAPRTRELLVEELSTQGRPKAETYDMRGVVRRSQRTGRSRPPLAPESNNENHQHQHHHNNRSRPFTTPYTHDADESTSRGSETLSRTTDSISALSMTDLDVSHSKQPVRADGARRRALDEAIAREDWDLAAALSEGMRTLKSKQVRSRQSGGEWTQSALDKFISQNDWDAVANYIAHIRARAKDDDNDNALPRSSSRGGSVGLSPSSSRVSAKRLGATSPSSRPASSFDTDDSSMLRKKFGARSQLQHDDMQSESGTSYDSEDSSSSGSDDSSSESSYSEPSSDVIGKRRYGASSGGVNNNASSRVNSSNSRRPPPRAPRSNSRPKEFAC